MQKEQYEHLSRRIQSWQNQQTSAAAALDLSSGAHALPVSLGRALIPAPDTSWDANESGQKASDPPSVIARLTTATDTLERQIASFELLNLVHVLHVSAPELTRMIQINRRTVAYLRDIVRSVCATTEAQTVNWKTIDDPLSHQVYQAKQLSALLQKLTESGNAPNRRLNAAELLPYSERDVEEMRRRAAAIRALGITIGQALGTLPVRYRRPRQCALMRTVTGVVEVVSGNRQT
jgi:hypothetical protein